MSHEIYAGEGKVDPFLDKIIMYDGPTGQYDPSYILVNPYEASAYRLETDRIQIHDAVWGKATIGAEPGDGVFFALLDHPVIRRLQGIEQLTLPQEMSTIPGTSQFSRWEHAWGSVVLTRRLAEPLRLDPREQRVHELRALLSDSSHWAFSHLGDWILQGSGGSEDEHDQEQRDFLIKTGVAEILEQFGHSLDEILVLSDKENWVEAKSPDLCVDRVDYGAREILRWLTRTPELKHTIQDFPFFVDSQDRLVMTSEKAAMLFTKAYLLLGSEHWQEPAHRLQERLLEEMVKHSLVYQEPMFMQPVGNAQHFHPRDYLMSVDTDFKPAMHTTHSLQWILYDLACAIGRSKRLIHRQIRASELDLFLQFDHIDFPDPLVSTYGASQQHPLQPINIEFTTAEVPEKVTDFNQSEHAVDFWLPALKPRNIDPLFQATDGTIQRLSQANPRMGEIMAQHQAVLSRSYVARIYMNHDYTRLVKTGLQDVEQQWPQQLNNPRMPDQVFRDAFYWGSRYGETYRLTHIDWRR